MEAFSFSKDSGNVRWGNTLWLNLLRAIAAGIVWAIFALIVNSDSPDAPSWWSLPFLAPIMYFILLPIYYITAKILTAILGDIIEGAINLMTFLCSFAIAIGDPLVFILHKFKPEFVPVDEYKFMNFRFVIMVLNEEGVEMNEGSL
ncbi:hypothetical protein [Candidatus Entotheonella palauensis]|uniref:Uncharacterized protein n=1 Tax=Candidatus Entotheonella gemina TaxID=1429439 RepID=W4MEI5_9BACT|nr:hypothetical protein [Candidatus Entotheonella palauensis]ETX08311.1 MAG: hypothetical protein ETSY2_06115 [Candidatus Entotheonella gemina]